MSLSYIALNYLRLFPIKKCSWLFYWIISFCFLIDDLMTYNLSTAFLALSIVTSFCLINCHPFIKTEHHALILTPPNPHLISWIELLYFFSLVVANFFFFNNLYFGIQSLFTCLTQGHYTYLAAYARFLYSFEFFLKTRFPYGTLC